MGLSENPSTIKPTDHPNPAHPKGLNNHLDRAYTLYKLSIFNSIINLYFNITFYGVQYAI